MEHNHQHSQTDNIRNAFKIGITLNYIETVRQYLSNLPEVAGIHDLHVWALSTSAAALTVHLKTRIQTDFTFIAKIQHELNDKFKIEHSTIQVEYGGPSELCYDCN